MYSNRTTTTVYPMKKNDVLPWAILFAVSILLYLASNTLVTYIVELSKPVSEHLL